MSSGNLTVFKTNLKAINYLKDLMLKFKHFPFQLDFLNIEDTDQRERKQTRLVRLKIIMNAVFIINVLLGYNFRQKKKSLSSFVEKRKRLLNDVKQVL